MPQLPIEDTTLGARALAYVIELHHELTAENGAPTLGSQNQAVEFICANPELSLAVTAWAKMVDVDEWCRSGACRLTNFTIKLARFCKGSRPRECSIKRCRGRPTETRRPQPLHSPA